MKVKERRDLAGEVHVRYDCDTRVIFSASMTRVAANGPERGEKKREREKESSRFSADRARTTRPLQIRIRLSYLHDIEGGTIDQSKYHSSERECKRGREAEEERESLGTEWIHFGGNARARTRVRARVDGRAACVRIRAAGRHIMSNGGDCARAP